jgi:hypothetical protein
MNFIIMKHSLTSRQQKRLLLSRNKNERKNGRKGEGENAKAM